MVGAGPPRTWLTYGRGVTRPQPSTATAVILYTLLRLALFGGVWALLWFFTPLDTLWSAVAALLISGALSLVLLDRQRSRVGIAAGRYFSRLNDRIDAAARAEDFDDDPPAPSPDPDSAR